MQIQLTVTWLDVCLMIFKMVQKIHNSSSLVMFSKQNKVNDIENDANRPSQFGPIVVSAVVFPPRVHLNTPLHHHLPNEYLVCCWHLKQCQEMASTLIAAICSDGSFFFFFFFLLSWVIASLQCWPQCATISLSVLCRIGYELVWAINGTKHFPITSSINSFPLLFVYKHEAAYFQTTPTWTLRCKTKKQTKKKSWVHFYLYPAIITRTWLSCAEEKKTAFNQFLFLCLPHILVRTCSSEKHVELFGYFMLLPKKTAMVLQAISGSGGLLAPAGACHSSGKPQCPLCQLSGEYSLTAKVFGPSGEARHKQLCSFIGLIYLFYVLAGT